MTRSTLAALVFALSATIATPGYSQDLQGQDSLTTSRAGTAGLRGRTYSFASQPRAAAYTPLRDSLNATRIGAGLAPIPYADLPTGGGTWANGGNLAITGGKLTIDGGKTFVWSTDNAAGSFIGTSASAGRPKAGYFGDLLQVGAT